jgi:hypothetical protein
MGSLPIGAYLRWQRVSARCFFFQTLKLLSIAVGWSDNFLCNYLQLNAECPAGEDENRTRART